MRELLPGTVHCNEASLHELEGLDAEVHGFMPPAAVVLFAHGDPIVGSGADALRAFLADAQ